MGETLVKNGNWLQCLFLEIIITFLLMFVILNITVTSKNDFTGFDRFSSYYGIYIYRSSTGSSMNPGRSIGSPTFWRFWFLWVYIFSTIIGAILAVYFKKTISR